MTVLQSVEPVRFAEMAFFSAAFIPLLLGFLGYAQSLKVDEFADERGEIKPEVIEELRALLADSLEQIGILRTNFIKERKARKAAQNDFEKLSASFAELAGSFNARPKIKCDRRRYLKLLELANGGGPKSADIGEHKIFILNNGLELPTDEPLKKWIVAAGFEVRK